MVKGLRARFKFMKCEDYTEYFFRSGNHCGTVMDILLNDMGQHIVSNIYRMIRMADSQFKNVQYEYSVCN